MPRKGALTKKTFFPATGDILEDPASGISWECARANTYRHEKDGTKVRYGMLVADPPADSGVTDLLTWAITDQDESPWLDGVQFIHRKIAEGEYKKYTLNDATGTWQE